MKKKRSRSHFQQVSLKHLRKLLERKSAGSVKDAEMSLERPTLKTEPYSIPFVVVSKKSR